MKTGPSRFNVGVGSGERGRLIDRIEELERQVENLLSHDMQIDWQYEHLTCSCGYDFEDAPATERFLDHALTETR